MAKFKFLHIFHLCSIACISVLALLMIQDSLNQILIIVTGIVLALAVTIVEVRLILSMMNNVQEGCEQIARDAVFSAVIIVTNGIAGFCFLLGGLKFKKLEFQVEGTTSLLVAQTMMNKDYFKDSNPIIIAQESKPSRAMAASSAVALAISLVAVIGLAKLLSPAIESTLNSFGAPKATVRIILALLVLLPEAGAAIGGANSDQLQTSLNLALGLDSKSMVFNYRVAFE